ncbi:MAG TPA: VPDSG-CTERM sorting domain-containing protein [Candidatus Limnocylindrales bacterium]|nr:VPDSG-CTERM sorting domain-containing protein [Candidatus Limnocylindrales bacterium]
MKKLLWTVALVASCGLVHATPINAPSSLIGTSVLDGNKAYEWGISIAVKPGQQVASAQIDFTNIKLTAANSSGHGYLYTDLLKSGNTGVHTFTDNDAAGDYFKTQFTAANITSLGTKNFASVGTTLSWSYVLTGTQLAVLNTYLLANGVFDIGLDPDCHYTVGGLSFTYTLGPTPKTSVPDVATTAFLLGISLAGLELLRRKFALAK